MASSIPERAPVGDVFTGVVLRYAENVFLASEDVPEATEILARGTLILRYGVRYLGKPHLSIVPGLLALDYGDMLTGEDAWQFIFKHSNLHPRADVVGYRNDGQDDMIPVKWLDLVETPDVLVYADAHAVKPIAQPVALIAATPENLPERLAAYLPRYESLSAWRTAEKDTL